MLPIYKDDNKNFMLMQTRWQSEIDPVLKNPLTNGIFLRDINLISGNTTINHLLGRKIQGWVLSDINGAATIYRSQPFNDLTLTLTSSAAVKVNLYVF